MLPAFPKPGQIRKQKPAVKVFRDGREACDLKTKAGREEYFSRIRKMCLRQGAPRNCVCRICGLPLRMEEAVFEHEDGRGHGGGHRDDRIEIEVKQPDGTVKIKQQNGAAHPLCNSQKGSRRGYDMEDLIP